MNRFLIIYPQFILYMESAAIGPDGTLYLGGSQGGVFMNTKPLNPTITISNEEESKAAVPQKFTLHQNYPNPFNPSTTISFDLNKPQKVKIAIFNPSGHKVKEFNLGYRSSGSHMFRFTMDGLASGIYLLQLQAEKKSGVLKIAFIK